MRSETGDASYQFIAVRLPYGVQTDEEDAQKALTFIQPDVSLVVNIKESVDAMERAVEATGTDISDFQQGQYQGSQSHDCSVCFSRCAEWSRYWDGPCSGKYYQVSSQNLEMVVQIFYPFPFEQAPKENNCLKPWELILLL